MLYAKSAIIKFTMVGNPEIKLLESRVRRKPQARFGEGYTEKGRLCYLAGYLLYTEAKKSSSKEHLKRLALRLNLTEVKDL